MFKEIVEVAKKQGLLENLTGQSKHVHIIELRKGEKVDGAKKNQQIVFSMSTKSGTEAKEKLEAIIKDVKEKHKKVINVVVEQKKGPGESFGDYGQIKKVFEQGTVKLAAKEGQVLLVDIWATWCGPCQKPMDHNQQMLAKNNWGDKVRIVGVSVDDDLQSVKERVNTKGWKSVEHLTLGSWDGEHGLIKDFQINGIPFICLVDTKGVINYCGHPMSINLEKRIEELLSEGAAPNENQETKQNVSGSEIIDTLSNEEFMEKNFGQAQFLSEKIIVKQSLNKGKISCTSEIEVYATARDQQLLDKYEKFVPKGAQLKKKVIEEVEVPKPQKICSGCEAQLNYPMYWCKWSEKQGDYRCRKCVQKKNEETYFEYKNNSVLLIEERKSIPKSNFGQNIQPKDIKQIEQPNQFGCNGCSECPEAIGVARYVCLCCRAEPNYYGDYVDVCEDCIQKYINNDEAITKAVNVDGHSKNHAFLRVLFNVQGYYKF